MSCMPISTALYNFLSLLFFPSSSGLHISSFLARLLHLSLKALTMASTPAALKAAFGVAMCVMLLHSSMGQQPVPAPAPAPSPMLPSDCPLYCGSQCGPICKARADAEARRCVFFRPEVVYNSCFEGCSSRCNGNSSAARGCCKINSCSASSCGNPCARSCCESCSSSAYYPFGKCMSSQEKVFGYCTSPCMTDCNNKCVNGQVPYTP
ncbi:hypothetical protein PAHAL_3G411600 [Panicum hallii]|uniref:Uncharacterized protein n=1 Tax=Panicum hallii TaxID=206008 RepID=A0A2S3HDP1_9POAL|nr:hypothetical protein PAHAL_3G411600 [Panicum hallii]